MSITIKEISAESTWDLRQRVMWPSESLEYVKLPEDKNGNHYGLFKDSELISVISVFIRDGEAQFRKFATEPGEQGKGYGTKLLSYLLQEMTNKKIQSLWCNARTHKTSFYKSFGLKETEMLFSKGGIDYVIMKKNY